MYHLDLIASSAVQTTAKNAMMAAPKIRRRGVKTRESEIRIGVAEGVRFNLP